MTTSTAPTTTTTLATTTTVDRAGECDSAMAEVYTTLDVVLDQADDDPIGFADRADEALTELFTELGGSMGTSCGFEEGPRAYSELVVYLSNQKSERTALTGTFIDGMLQGFCAEPPFDLTLPAQAVCLAADS